MKRKPSIRTIAFAAGMLCLLLASCAEIASAERVAMKLNESRILVACQAQKDVFGGISPWLDWAGFAERDLLLFDLKDTEILMVLEAKRQSVSESDAEQVVRMSDCRDGDKYVLIGKDGSVKRRWTGQLEIDDLFQTIDAMPMRQFEMKRRK